MRKTHGTKTFFLQNFVWLAGLAMAIVNLWLATKLAPLAESIGRLDLRVSAVERELQMHDSSMDKLGSKIDTVIYQIGDLKQYCHP